mmetsp:Transcript_68110/g.188736  ORF Transcript_68110/g.188736 Transcript_68110/m.188736 type:complete len:205 (-) Transcript_68110:623-1237(-)
MVRSGTFDGPVLSNSPAPPSQVSHGLALRLLLYSRPRTHGRVCAGACASARVRLRVGYIVPRTPMRSGGVCAWPLVPRAQQRCAFCAVQCGSAISIETGPGCVSSSQDTAAPSDRLQPNVRIPAILQSGLGTPPWRSLVWPAKASAYRIEKAPACPYPGSLGVAIGAVGAVGRSLSPVTVGFERPAFRLRAKLLGLRQERVDDT